VTCPVGGVEAETREQALARSVRARSTAPSGMVGSPLEMTKIASCAFSGCPFTVPLTLLGVPPPSGLPPLLPPPAAASSAPIQPSRLMPSPPPRCDSGPELRSSVHTPTEEVRRVPRSVPPRSRVEGRRGSGCRRRAVSVLALGRSRHQLPHRAPRILPLVHDGVDLIANGELHPDLPREVP